MRPPRRAKCHVGMRWEFSLSVAVLKYAGSDQLFQVVAYTCRVCFDTRKRLTGYARVNYYHQGLSHFTTRRYTLGILSAGSIAR